MSREESHLRPASTAITAGRAASGSSLAPALWEAEFTNVIWMSVRAGAVAIGDAPIKLELARRLGIHTVPVRSLWHGALLRAMQAGVAVYDALFVELAEREGVSLVTFDKRILQAWPGIARRPGAAH